MCVFLNKAPRTYTPVLGALVYIHSYRPARRLSAFGHAFFRTLSHIYRNSLRIHAVDAVGPRRPRRRLPQRQSVMSPTHVR